MRFLVLATDYDGTIAVNGHVAESVWIAIRRLRESGRRTILVTGRELEELRVVCSHLDLFDRIVAENGAIIYDPSTNEVRQLCEPPPAKFAASLRALGIAPLSVGHVIVSTVKPFENVVLNAINEHGLEMQVIFNQESVMALPSGVNKATGLAAALADLGCSAHNVAGIGDAENDHALLTACECGAAVGDAIPALRERADIVMNGGSGAAAIELIDQILADDLKAASARIRRHDIRIGITPDGRNECISPFGKSILIAGTSGSGKSVLCTGLLERLNDAKYQFVVIDPEGDYGELVEAVVVGTTDHEPKLDDVIHLVSTGRNVVVNLVGMPLADRPALFERLFPRLLDLRTRSGRPHWIVIDEAHHLMPTSWTPAMERIPVRLRNMVLITVHPGSVSPIVLGKIDLMMTLGQNPAATIGEFCVARRISPPTLEPIELQSHEAIAFWVDSNRGFKLKTSPPRSEQRRHRRKYAEGRLPESRNFIFSGPKGKLNLRAYNLIIFLELASGVDDATWLHHLKRGDYSNWFRKEIKDEELAQEVAAIETRFAKVADASREAVRKAIEARYTLPAETAAGAKIG